MGGSTWRVKSLKLDYGGVIGIGDVKVQGSGSHPWLHIVITSRAFKNLLCLMAE